MGIQSRISRSRIQCGIARSHVEGAKDDDDCLLKPHLERQLGKQYLKAQCDRTNDIPDFEEQRAFLGSRLPR